MLRLNLLEMLAEIAAEALHFLTRRDLDKLCVVNKQFNGLIDLYCDVDALRSVFKVELLPSISDVKLTVLIEEKRDSGTYHTFGGMDEVVYFIGSILRHSNVERLELRDPGYLRSGIFSLGHLTMLIEATRFGAVRFLVFSCVDFSAFDDDVFHIVLGCRGLQSLGVQWSVVPGGYVTDALIRSGAAKGLLELHVFTKIKRDTLYILSDDAVLDFFFRAGDALGRQSLSLSLRGTGLTDMFISKFFERLLSTPVQPCGNLEFHDAREQRGLSAYAQYLTPRAPHSFRDTYRFPSIGNNDEACEVRFDGGSTYTSELHLWFHVVSRYS